MIKKIEVIDITAIVKTINEIVDQLNQEEELPDIYRAGFKAGKKLACDMVSAMVQMLDDKINEVLKDAGGKI